MGCFIKNRSFFLRLALEIALTLLVFGYLCRPCVIDGASMLPTYGEHGITFCWRPGLWFRPLKFGDIVIVRLVGNKVLMLKRVLGLPGDTVEFREGSLFVNGEERNECWERLGPCDWNMEAVQVKDGEVFVIGDNRSVPLEQHLGGIVKQSRICGKPLF